MIVTWVVYGPPLLLLLATELCQVLGLNAKRKANTSKRDQYLRRPLTAVRHDLLQERGSYREGKKNHLSSVGLRIIST